MIAFNFKSSHPVLGFLTNLVDRFIIATIRANSTQVKVEEEEHCEATTSKKQKIEDEPKRDFTLEIIDTDEDNCKNKLEMAILAIAYWLSQCSKDDDFKYLPVSVQNEFISSYFNTKIKLRQKFKNEENEKYAENT